MPWVSEMHTQERVLCSGVFAKEPVVPVTEGLATDWYLLTVRCLVEILLRLDREQ